MAKDPAFLFYSSDFLIGIADLTMTERGQYITMLCLQHQKGPLSEKSIQIAVGEISVDLRKKFLVDKDGNLYNQRLFDEYNKRKKFTESRRNNAKSKKHMLEHMGDHMEDENEDVNVNVYRKFKHLSLSLVEFDKLLSEGYTNFEVDAILDSIQNYKANTKYTSLYLTAKKWLKKEHGNKPPGKIENFLNNVELAKSM